MKQRMTVEEVAEAVGIGARTFTSYVARGQAPKPVGFSPENGRRVWRGTDIEYWMQDRPGRGRRPSTWREHVGMRSAKTARKGGTDTPSDGDHVPPEPPRKPAKAATKKTAPKNAAAAPAAAKASAKTTPAAATKKPSAGKKASSSSTKKTSSTKKAAAQKPAAARSPRKTSAKKP